MTIVYMTKDKSFLKEAKDDAVQALVPFGGSAERVPNPDRSILGGKGLGLQEMGAIGIDVSSSALYGTST